MECDAKPMQMPAAIPTPNPKKDEWVKILRVSLQNLYRLISYKKNSTHKPVDFQTYG